MKIRAYIISIILFYLWTIASSSLFSNWLEAPSPEKAALHYNHLTSGLMHKQLSLYFPSEAEMATGKYNPNENDPKKMDDVTPYNGKYYLYFGVVPVILIFLPFQLITGWALPQELACWFVLSGTFLFSYLILNMLIVKFFSRSQWVLWFVIPSLGLSCCALQLLRRARHYELAISSGQFFLTGGLYFGFRAILRKGNEKLNLFAATLFFVSALGSRPTTAFTIALFMGFYFIEYLGRTNTLPEKPRKLRNYFALTGTFISEHLLSIFLPLSTGIFLLLYYNYMRFGQWLEFGLSILVTSYNHPNFEAFSLFNIPLNLVHYLSRPYPEATGGFGTISKIVSVLSKYYEQVMRPFIPPRYLNYEPTFGLIFLNPFSYFSIVWLVPSLLCARTTLEQGKKSESNFWGIRGFGLFFLFAAVINLIFLTTVGGICQRYHIEFVLPLFSSAVLAWITLFDRLKEKGATRNFLGLISLALIAIGLYFSGTTYVQSHKDLNGLRTWLNRKLLYTQTKAPSKLLELSKNDIVLLVKFPDKQTETREPLVVAGSPLEADMVYVKYLSDHRVQFGVNHWGMKEIEGKSVMYTPEAFHKIEFLLGFQYPKPKYLSESNLLFPFMKSLYLSDELALIRVTMDDQITLNTYTLYYESSRHRLNIGRNPLGGGFVSEKFSGTLVQ